MEKLRSELYSVYYRNKVPNFAANRANFINYIVDDNCNEDTKDKIKDKLNELIWNDQKWNILCEPIHACHKIYISKCYEEKFKCYKEYQELLLLILKNIEWSKFSELSNLIKKYVDSENMDLTNKNDKLN